MWYRVAQSCWCQKESYEILELHSHTQNNVSIPNSPPIDSQSFDEDSYINSTSHI